MSEVSQIKTLTVCLFKQLMWLNESSYNSFIHFHSFIHSDHFYSAFKSPTTQRRSRLQHGYCIGFSRRSAQATAGKGLAQGPYMAARAGVEPTTLRLKAIYSTKAPPCPAIGFCILKLMNVMDVT